MPYQYRLGNAQKRILLTLYSYNDWIGGISEAWSHGLMRRKYPLIKKQAYMTQKGKRYEYRITRHGVRYVEKHRLNQDNAA